MSMALRPRRGSKTTAHSLVEQFYERIWNRGDLTAARTLLRDDVTFVGSLGVRAQGVTAFLQ